MCVMHGTGLELEDMNKAQVGIAMLGSSSGKDVLDIISAFQSYGSYIAGSISEEKRYDIVKHSCPGPGACGNSTANTMASAIEALGMSLPYSSSIPAEYPESTKNA
ncbi:dihydroxy-acid dehydratase [Gigaspora margarita]|uniref:Dihydroxy-acid dehydratase n=1 Tax=Gigaspora margarita TaxID=4874 RepID=A0A8H4ET12_GIGMA|nr:dihydroxy-acid dehydratase [Gigaspora margarita]